MSMTCFSASSGVNAPHVCVRLNDGTTQKVKLLRLHQGFMTYWCYCRVLWPILSLPSLQRHGIPRCGDERAFEEQP